MDWIHRLVTKVPETETADDAIEALALEGDNPMSLGDDPDKPPPGERAEKGKR